MTATAAAAAPQRVVSINLCTDQLVLALLPRAQIASLSQLVIDPDLSLAAAQVRDIPLNNGLAEELLALQPDRVVTGPYSDKATLALLRELGYPVMTLAIAQSLADIRRHLIELGEALGAEARAQRLVITFDQRLQAVSRSVDDSAPLAVYLQPNGYTAGSGTLADDLIRHAGLRNLGAELGIHGFAKVSLEQLLMAAPEIVITDQHSYRYPSLATELLDHPAIAALSRQAQPIRIPQRLWICGLPGSLEVLALLTRVHNRADLGDGPR
jgi:iron complex transport system substrate-binding protein